MNIRTEASNIYKGDLNNIYAITAKLQVLENKF